MDEVLEPIGEAIPRRANGYLHVEMEDLAESGKLLADGDEEDNDNVMS